MICFLREILRYTQDDNPPLKLIPASFVILSAVKDL